MVGSQPLPADDKTFRCKLIQRHSLIRTRIVPTSLPCFDGGTASDWGGERITNKLFTVQIIAHHRSTTNSLCLLQSTTHPSPTRSCIFFFSILILLQVGTQFELIQILSPVSLMDEYISGWMDRFFKIPPCMCICLEMIDLGPSIGQFIIRSHLGRNYPADGHGTRLKCTYPLRSSCHRVGLFKMSFSAWLKSDDCISSSEAGRAQHRQ